jgi:hypothetical protein
MLGYSLPTVLVSIAALCRSRFLSRLLGYGLRGLARRPREGACCLQGFQAVTFAGLIVLAAFVIDLAISIRQSGWHSIYLLLR